MPYNVPTTWVAADVLTAAQLNAQVRDNVAFLANPPACRVHHSVNQTIPDAVETTVLFNSERWDTATMHDPVTNSGRITVPIAGIYRFSFRGMLIAGTDYIAAYAVLQSSSGVNLDKDERLPTQFNNASFHVDVDYKMAAGDWVVVRIYQDNTANAARTLAANGNYTPEFSATWVGLG